LTYSPHVHQLQFRFIPTFLEFPFCLKPVLGCLLGISLIEEYEILEEKHILFAVKKIIPQAELVKGSCCYLDQKEEKIKIIYLELEKRDGTSFSLAERQGLKRSLKGQLQNCIEKLMPPIFMIRNEEEVLRNILMLRGEIRSTKDIPQVMISLDRQTTTEIIFTIIWVCIRKQDTPSLQKMIEQDSKDHTLLCERVQIVGYLRKKHPIEVHVLRLNIPRDPKLLRSDLSLNFYLAREKAASYLHKTLGEFRDYNGGVIFKQTEILARLKDEFRKIAATDPDLIDDFFYSISPIEKQATISFSSLKTLFELFYGTLEVELNDRCQYFLETYEEGSALFVIVRFLEGSLKDHLTVALDISIHQHLIVSDLSMKGTGVLSYIYENQNPAGRSDFCNRIQQTIETWHNKI
jgi:oligopeptide transport system substrate-binding protein